MGQITISKTVYDDQESSDGKRILVMRLWPRGVKKTHIDLWLKEAGTSRELIKDWKSGKVSWSEYQQRYVRDMKGAAGQAAIEEIANRAKQGPISLLCSCRNPLRCHRSILKGLVEERVS